MARYVRARDSQRVEDQSRGAAAANPMAKSMARAVIVAATAGDARSASDIGMWSLNYLGMDDRGVRVMVSLVGPVRVEW